MCEYCMSVNSHECEWACFYQFNAADTPWIWRSYICFSYAAETGFCNLKSKFPVNWKTKNKILRDTLINEGLVIDNLFPSQPPSKITFSPAYDTPIFTVCTLSTPYFAFYVCPFCIILSLTFIFTLSLLFLSFSSTFPPFIPFLFFPQRNCLIFHHV